MNANGPARRDAKVEAQSAKSSQASSLRESNDNNTNNKKYSTHNTNNNNSSNNESCVSVRPEDGERFPDRRWVAAGSGSNDFHFVGLAARKVVVPPAMRLLRVFESSWLRLRYVPKP